MGKYVIKKKEANPPAAVTEGVIDPLPARFKDVQPPNRYDDETREEICRLVLETGLTIKAAAQKYGIARNTCSAIVREYIAEHDMIENVRLGRKFHKLADRVLNELQERDLSLASPHQLAVVAGIAVDKKTQLMGKPGDLSGGVRLRIAWQDGSGAVELTTGPAATGPGNHNPAPILRVRAGEDQDDPGQGDDHSAIIDVDATPTPASPPDAADSEDDLW
ncbi:MAG: hypothetical protein K6T66_01015 [Peptococcaceae bacterium]|nr:hypothetical protein [Peptococcaceae bacterium]